ncbi:otoconin-90 [Rhineura floridana]|uniref:otoconin-90 n=1 Tax=Rhineura floridana TaxID=261503 RepID=UPI002AC7F6AF|nr:otoconin-90 [Rhineura floridana]
MAKDNITFFNGVFANVESVALFFDCLGSHFTWLQSIFTSFPALLNFVSKMKCVTGICPRDFEDYGCACRFEMEGLPVDKVDGCCFQHRECYEEATEQECVWDPAKITMDVSCLTKNITCESNDPCEHLLCNCDKAAIECFLHSHINSSLNGLDVSFCPSLVTEIQHQRPEDTQLTDTSVAEAASGVESDGGRETHREGNIPPESSDLLLRNPEEGVTPDMESGGGLEILREGEVHTHELSDHSNQIHIASLLSSTTFLTKSKVLGGCRQQDMALLEATDLQGEEGKHQRFGLKWTGLPLFCLTFCCLRSAGNHFRIGGEEGTTFSTMSPEETPDPDETFGEVCDRFTFLQLRDNGRVKRVLPQLGEMLYCLTDRCPEDFELYGCYCGQEGKGHPTDDLDRCCFSHHCCLEQLKKLGCHPERNSRSEVVCFDQTPKCIGWTMCEKLQCSCDKAAAECMAASFFNESLMAPNRQACPEVKLFCRRGGHDRPLSSTVIGASASSEEDRSSEEAELGKRFLRRGKRAAGLGRENSRAIELQRR